MDKGIYFKNKSNADHESLRSSYVKFLRLQRKGFKTVVRTTFALGGYDIGYDPGIGGNTSVLPYPNF